MRVLIVIACLLLAGGGRYALYASTGQTQESLKEVLLLPPGKVIRQLDLGHHALAADLLFIRANLYYGQHILGDEQLPWLSDFISTLLEVDPEFQKAYIWGAMVTVFPKRQMQFTPPDLVHRANRILEAGMRRFPQDQRFPLRLAFNHYYELGDTDAAIPYFERAANTPGSPPWLKHKLVDLYSKVGKTKLAREMLIGILSDTTDPLLNQALKERLRTVMDEEERDRLMASRRSLLTRWHAQYAFVPIDLYIVIQEP